MSKPNLLVWNLLAGGGGAPLPGPTPVPNLIRTGASSIHRLQGTDAYIDEDVLAPIAAAEGVSVYDFLLEVECYWEASVGDPTENYPYRYLSPHFPFQRGAGTLRSLYFAHVYVSNGSKTIRLTLHYRGKLWEATLPITVTERSFTAAQVGVFDPAAEWSLPGIPAHSPANRFTTWAAALAFIHAAPEPRKLFVRSGAAAPYQPSAAIDLNDQAMIEEYGGTAPAEMQVLPQPYHSARWSVVWDGVTTSWTGLSLPATNRVAFGGNFRLDPAHYSSTANSFTLLAGHSLVAGDRIGVWQEDPANTFTFIDETPTVAAPKRVFTGLPLTLPQSECRCLINGVEQASGWQIVGEMLVLDADATTRVQLVSRRATPSDMKSTPTIFNLAGGNDQIISGIKATTGYDAGDPGFFDGLDLRTLNKASNKFLNQKSVRKARVTAFNLVLSGFDDVVSPVLNSEPDNYGFFFADSDVTNWSNYGYYDSGWIASALLGVRLLQHPFARNTAPGKAFDRPGRINSPLHGAARSPGSKRFVMSCVEAASRTSWAQNGYGWAGGFDCQPTFRLATSDRDKRSYSVERCLCLNGASHFSAGPPNDMVAVVPPDPIQIVASYMLIPEFGDKAVGAYGRIASKCNIYHLMPGLRRLRSSPKRVFSTTQGGPNLLSQDFIAKAGPTLSDSDTFIIESGSAALDLVLGNSGTWGIRGVANVASIVDYVADMDNAVQGPRILQAGDISGDFVVIPVKLNSLISRGDYVPTVMIGPDSNIENIAPRPSSYLAMQALYEIGSHAQALEQWRNGSAAVINRVSAPKDVRSVRFRRLPGAPAWAVGQAVWITLEPVGGSQVIYGDPPDDWEESDGLPVVSVIIGDALYQNPVVPIPSPAPQIRNPAVYMAAGVPWKSVTYRQGHPEPLPADGPLDALGRPMAGSPALGSATTPRLLRDIAGGLRGATPSRGAFEPATLLVIPRLYANPVVTATWARIFAAGDTVTAADLIVNVVDPGYPAVSASDCRKVIRVKRGDAVLRPAASYVLQTDDVVMGTVEVPSLAELLRVSAVSQFLTSPIYLRNTNPAGTIATAGWWALSRSGGWVNTPHHFAVRIANNRGWTGAGRRYLSGGTGNLGLNVDQTGLLTIRLANGAGSHPWITPAAGEQAALIISCFPGEAVTMRSFSRIGLGTWTPGPTGTVAIGDQFSTETTNFLQGANGLLDVTVDTGLLWLTGRAQTANGSPDPALLFDAVTGRPTNWPTLSIPGCEVAGLLWGASSFNAAGNGNAGVDTLFTTRRNGVGMVAV